MAVKAALSRCAVEEYPVNLSMLFQEGREIICYSASGVDGGVEAAGPMTFGEYIPQRDTSVGQSLQALPVGKFRTGAEQFAHDGPEGIARMGIVLTGVQ